MVSLPYLLAALLWTEPAWQFAAPPAGDAFEAPPLHTISLSGTQPDDVRVMVNFRGTRQRYAQLRYGSPGSVRVTIVVDEIKPGEVDLYVDADRNRRIQARDLVKGEGRTWRLPLDVAMVAGEITTYLPRAILLRLGASGQTLSLAAAGYLEGTVQIGGKPRAARRTDGDANGFYTDPQDRIWIDLDGDGRWDPVAEQFLYMPILTIGDERLVVRSDPEGTRLALQPLEGTGTLALAMARPETKAHLTELRVMLVGRDGSALGLSSAEPEIKAPVGEYRVGALTLTLSDSAGGPPWSFVFSDNGSRPEKTWYKIEKDKRLAIDPIGTLEFRPEFPTGQDKPRPGEPLTVLPRLYTGDGLLINAAYRGATSAGHEGPSALVALSTGDERILDSSHSGFA